MYLCNCNGLTVNEVRKVCSDGISNAEDVFKFFGVEECCGKCIPEIKEYITTQDRNISFQSAKAKSSYEHSNYS